MTAIASPSSSLAARIRPALGPAIGRHGGAALAVLVAACLLVLVNALSLAPLGYFDFLYLSSGGLTLAIAAMGASIVILTGGFDLSVGATISLVNVIVATQLGDSAASQIGMAVAGVAIGALIGAFNGFFVAVLRLQSIVVTLASMFIVGGIALSLLDRPSGYVPASFSNFFVGDAIPGVLPSAVAVLAAVATIWLLIANTRFGNAIQAVGSDADAARAAGIRVAAVTWGAYVLGGAFYGLAGVIVTAQTATGDPLVGNPLLLQIFAAVVLGGTLLGGGRGGAIGAIFGAYSLMLIVNILLVLNVSAYYASVVEGAVLILAALLGVWSTGGIRNALRALAQRLQPMAATHPRQPLVTLIAPRSDKRSRAGWLQRNREALRYSAPAFLCFGLVIVATRLLLGPIGGGYANAILLLGSFLIVLALGQGAVILSGGLDLSVPWTIGLCGILAGGLMAGSDGNLWWAVPAVLATGAAIGLANGLGVTLLGLPAIVVTLGMNGILQGIALLYSGGTPAGFAAPGLRWLMNGSLGGVTPVVWFVAAFAILGHLLLSRTPFGRRVYAIGNSRRVARLSGVNVSGTTIGVYALSGICSAIVGLLLTGFGGQASLGMGDAYLLPSIAVVVIGGTLITGGRGYYIGMIGGVLLLTALQTLMAGTTVPPALREVVYGLVVLVAVVALRERD